MSVLRGTDRFRLYLREADRRSAIFFLVAFLLNLGFGCGMASANALLVGRVGTEPLFLVYLSGSILTFLLAGLTYVLVDRFSRGLLFALSFEIFAAVILFLWWRLGGASSSHWPLYTARVLSDVFYVLAFLQFWLLTGDYFTNLEAKLRFPLFVAAGGLGYMVGALLLQQFAAQAQVVNFFLVWSGCLALLPVLFAFLPRARFRTESITRSPDSRDAEAPHVPLTVPAARLLRTLFFFWMIFTFVCYGVDYVFNSVALQALPDENLLAAFFGKVAFFSLLAVFLFQTFLAGRLAMWLSVDRSLAVLGFALFLGCCLIAWHPALGSVAFAEGLLFYFLDSKAVALLQPVGNLFPDSLRGRVKVLLDGFAPAAGDAILLGVALVLSGMAGLRALTYVLAGVTAVFLIYPLAFRRTYLNYLTDSLGAPDGVLVLNAVHALGEKGSNSAVKPLLDLMDGSQDIFLKRNIVLALGRIRDDRALPRIIELFSVPQESLQLAVIEALGSYRNYPSLFALYEFMKSQENVSFQVRMSATLLMTRLVGGRMIPLLKEALLDADERIQANAIESLALLENREIIPLVLPYLEHPNRRLRANAAIALHPFRSRRKQAAETVAALFQSKDPLTRFAGIYAIGELGLKEYRAALEEMLSHPDQRYRRQVLAALAKMGVGEYVRRFAESLAAEDETQALDAFRVLGRFSRPSRWMVFEEISKLTPQARETVIARLDRSPFDFFEERRLLTARRTGGPSRSGG